MAGAGGCSHAKCSTQNTAASAITRANGWSNTRVTSSPSQSASFEVNTVIDSVDDNFEKEEIFSLDTLEFYFQMTR
eukprot:m.19297 g.19297  ORF g.19297 m.19297 type:complete len:76 (+) comp11759_c0_seq1:48-275(+)